MERVYMYVLADLIVSGYDHLWYSRKISYTRTISRITFSFLFPEKRISYISLSHANEKWVNFPPMNPEGRTPPNNNAEGLIVVIVSL